MANNGTIAHRFANKDYNFERGLKGSSTHISGKNYYSYSTVFGQWVDEKVCLVYQGSTSPSSSKHQLGSWNFPKDVVVLPYDDGGRGGYYYSWHGCDLLGWSGEWNFNKRMILMKYYVGEMFNALKAIKGGKKKHLESWAARAIEENWKYIVTLVGLYKDTSVPKFLKYYAGNKDLMLERRMLKAMHKGTFAVPELVDIIFGKGTFKAYYDYCARFRKSADKRAKVEALCKRLGIRSPYENWGGYGVLGHNMSADDIRKMSAKERLDIHFRALAYKEYNAHESERNKKYNKNFRNAYKWIVGFEPKKSSWGGGYEDEVGNNCVNKDTGKVYECSGTNSMYDSFDWCGTIVRFDYDDFRKSEDKEKWIAEFYKKCEYAAMLRRAYDIFNRVNAHFEKRSFREKKFLDDDYLRENVSDSEYEVCKKYIAAQDKHYADEEARQRAAELARKQREEEERKEKELQAQIKREQIQKCLEDGVDGCRTLWYNHYTSIAQARQYAHDIDAAVPFFYGGNVLLRFGINKDKIESSKDIRVTIPTCKAMWKMVSKWHEHPETFKEMTIKTLDGTYTISSYENDILTAGCHDIAYAEMERMYNEIINA